LCTQYSIYEISVVILLEKYVVVAIPMSNNGAVTATKGASSYKILHPVRIGRERGNARGEDGEIEGTE
jgi:hypothetical protein